MTRPCAGCDTVDDGPRHVTGLANAPAIIKPPPDWHPTCHAKAGCITCAELIKESTDG